MCRYFNEQYGTNFISVMPTNLYGLGDNFNLETSHVLPAVLRKIYLAKCLENGAWEAIRKDLDRRPIEGIDGKADEEIILDVLKKHGIYCAKSAISSKQSSVSRQQLAKRNEKVQTANRQLQTVNCQLPTDPLGYRFSPP